MGMPSYDQPWRKHVDRHSNKSRAFKPLIRDTWTVMQYEDIQQIVNATFQACRVLLVILPLRPAGIPHNSTNTSDPKPAEPNFFAIEIMDIYSHAGSRSTCIAKRIMIASHTGNPLKLAAECLPYRGHIACPTPLVQSSDRVQIASEYYSSPLRVEAQFR